MSDGLGIAAAKHHRSSTLGPLLSPVHYLDEAGAAEYLLISPRRRNELRMKHGGPPYLHLGASARCTEWLDKWAEKNAVSCTAEELARRPHDVAVAPKKALTTT